MSLALVSARCARCGEPAVHAVSGFPWCLAHSWDAMLADGYPASAAAAA